MKLHQTFLMTLLGLLALLPQVARADCSVLPTSLVYPDSRSADCVSAQKIEGSPTIVAVEFLSGEEGTSTLINEKRFGLYDLTQNKWLFEPFTTERDIRSSDGSKKIALAEAQWKKDPRLSLYKKDLNTQKQEKIWPLKNTGMKK
jgi:hypothetical protein